MLFSAATATVSTGIGRCGIRALRLKSCHGERHIPEKVAGAFVCVGKRAFLIGYAVIGCLYKKKGGTYKSDYREYADRNNETCTSAFPFLHNEAIVKAISYNLGKVTACTAYGTASTFRNASAKYYRLYGINNCGRRVCAYGIGVANSAKAAASLRGIGGNRAISSVKHYVLFKYGETLEALASSKTKTSLEFELDVITNLNSEESAVKWNLLKVNVYAERFSALGPY